MSKASILMIFVVVTMLSGCVVPGSGSIVVEEENFNFTDFTYVDVGAAFEVEIIQSDSFSVTIIADHLFLKNKLIQVAKRGETLKIYLDPNLPLYSTGFFGFIQKAKTFKAKITMPILYGLRLYKGTNGVITGFRSSNDFNLDLSDESSLKGYIEAGDVKFNISGSKVTLEGSANNITLSANGISNLNLADFPLNNANVTLRAMTEATLNVNGRLDCDLKDLSTLYFVGNPTMGKIKTSSGSKVKRKTWWWWLPFG